MQPAEPDAFESIEPMVVDSRSLASQLTARLRELITSGALGRRRAATHGTGTR